MALTNRIRGSYCKLGTSFFPLQFYLIEAEKTRHDNFTDQENQATKMFIIPLGNWIELVSNVTHEIKKSVLKNKDS